MITTFETALAEPRHPELAAALVLMVPATPALASDSVRVPGQIPVEQCPVGYQYNTGIEVISVNLQDVSVAEQVAPAQKDAIKAREDEGYAYDGAQASFELLARRNGLPLTLSDLGQLVERERDYVAAARLRGDSGPYVKIGRAHV